MKKTDYNINKVSLLLGSNLGDKIYNILTAENDLSKFLNIVKYSSFYESKSWGYNSENSFVNRAVLVESSNSPLELLCKLQDVEKALGRIKNTNEGYQDRLIDIDILTFNDELIMQPKLVIPHPRIKERKFTILPLLDLYGLSIVPGMNVSAKQLLLACKDDREVKKINV